MPALSQNLTFTINSSTTVQVDYPNSGTNTLVYYSNPAKGDGYYGSGDGFHTVGYSCSYDFIGTVTMQATLASIPNEIDWFNINGTSSTVTMMLSTATVYIHNFIGNYVWIRGKVEIDQGILNSIQYNH